MEDKIQQARLAAFEEWMKTQGVTHVESAWRAFNAALDCVVIELPPELHAYSGQPQDERLLDADRNHTIKQCRAAIESTNLGIKVR